MFEESFAKDDTAPTCYPLPKDTSPTNPSSAMAHLHLHSQIDDRGEALHSEETWLTPWDRSCCPPYANATAQSASTVKTSCRQGIPFVILHAYNKWQFQCAFENRPCHDVFDALTL